MNMYIVKVFKDSSDVFTGKLFNTHTEAAVHYIDLMIKYGIEDENDLVASTGLINGIRVELPTLITL
jgi:hypothetical protein